MSSSEKRSVFGGREDAQIAIPQPVELGTGCKYLIEAADVRVEHRVEVLLDGCDQ